MAKILKCVIKSKKSEKKSKNYQKNLQKFSLARKFKINWKIPDKLKLNAKILQIPT
jgi:hypothetical protein